MKFNGAMVLGKRCIAVFSALIMLFSAACVRLTSLALDSDELASKISSFYLLELGVNRGEILDCNGLPLVNEKTEHFAAVPPDDESIAAIERYGADRAALEQLKSGFPAAVKVGADFYSDSMRVFSVRKRYQSESACHIIGHLDADGHGAAGLEKAFDEQLYGDQVSVRFRRNAKGEILCGVAPELSGEKTRGAVYTTIDKRLQYAAEAAARQYLKKGAVVVLDNANGKIRAICSVPTFDAENLAKSLDDPSLPFVNRALSAYNCGSVFKLSVAAAALHSGGEMTHLCTGSEKAGTVRFGCLRQHGRLDMEHAVAYSCNAYFIALGRRTGADECYRTAKLMGFGAETYLAKGMISAAGTLNSLSDLRQNPAALANFSFGQGDITATPLQIASMVQCIANGGKRYIPSLVEAVSDPDGVRTEYEVKPPVNVMTEQAAEKLRSCMVAAMKYGTGKSAAVSGAVCGGKTATAQTGKYDSSGKELLQAWFAGFVIKNGKSYTIVVMAENGVSGGVSAGPVYSKIAAAL